MFRSIPVRIISLLFLVVITFIMIFIFWEYSERKTLDKLLYSRVEERKTLFNDIVKLRETSIERHTNFEYSLWDEMVDFVKTGDKEWAKEGIDPALSTYQINAIWVYDTNFHLVYSINNLKLKGFKELPLPADTYNKLFVKSNTCHFFVDTPAGIMEIFGATIHPTIDTYRKTPPKGYYLVGRLLNITSLAKLTKSTITIKPVEKGKLPKSFYNIKNGEISFPYTLYGWDGKPLKYIYVRNVAPIFAEAYRSANRVFLLSIIFALVLLTLLFLSLMLWVSKPLKLISMSLNLKNPKILDNLQNETEFGRLAILINNFFKQQQELINEIKIRKQVEEALKVSEANYFSIFEAVQNAIVIYDVETLNLLNTNSKLGELFGYTSQEALQLKIEDFCGKEPGYTYKDIIKFIEKAKTGEPQTFEWLVKNKVGQFFWVKIYMKLVIINNKNCLLVTIEDISERKKLEAQLLKSQRIKDIGILASGVAHDFKNFLTVIILNAELILANLKPSDSAYNEIKTILNAATRAVCISRQLLYFIRGETPETVILNLNKVITEMNDIFLYLISDKNIELKVCLEPELKNIKANPGYIEQVVLNLVVNAIEAMPKGGKLVVETKNSYLDEATSRMYADLVPGEYVVLSILDTGIGIPPTVMEHIFEFSFTTKVKGLGLGLFIVYEIVKQCGGQITVHSKVGEGTTFKIYLPAFSEKSKAV